MGRSLSLSADRTLWMEGGTRTKAASRRSNFLRFTLLMLFLIGASLFYVWSRIQVIQYGYEISHAMKNGRGFVEENNKLRLEIATLKAYAKIERFATEELGMSKPKADQVIVIR